MKLHNVQQGSQEWHDLRARVKHTASDLPAIRGNSRYKTRTQAVREAATGIKPEVTEFMQRKFDEGHAAEAAARTIVEKMIGEELYPSVATTDDEYLLASTDGATMLGDTGYEHKLFNTDVVAQIAAGKLDPMYTDQMDQQIAVYGFERIIFVCSDGTDANFHWLGYTGDRESIARIRADWEQFDRDVANYQPEVIESKPILTANPLDHLPALVIEVTGHVTHSNLVQFKAAATAVIGGIKTDLVTDQDFLDATAAVKYLKDVEDNAKKAKQNALDQTVSIADLHRALDDVIKMAADVRKALDRKITEEKDRRKEDIIVAASRELGMYCAALSNRVGFPVNAAVSFADAIKGMRSLEAMCGKVSAVLANAKVDANAIADRIDANLKSLEGEGHSWRFLFPDLAAVCTKAADDFSALLSARIAAHKEAESKRQEAEREKIRREEQAKAEANARAQREAEEAAARTKQQEAERAEKQQAAQAIETTKVEQEPAIPNGDGIARDTPLHAVAAPADTGATIKLGDICTHLGFTVTADFLGTLGFQPAKVDKAAKLYSESSFKSICRALINHIAAVANDEPMKKAA